MPTKGRCKLLMKGIQELGSCVVAALPALGVFKVHAMTRTRTRICTAFTGHREDSPRKRGNRGADQQRVGLSVSVRRIKWRIHQNCA